MAKGFTLYNSDGDDQIFERPDGSKDKNSFVFTGFGNGIHPYHRKQLNWIKEMLASAGVILNLKEVPTVGGIGSGDSGEFDVEDLYLPKERHPSSNGMTYILIQDTEMGRGWAVLLHIGNISKGIILQDHRDSVRDWLLRGDFIRSFGVQYKEKTVKDLSKIK